MNYFIMIGSLVLSSTFVFLLIRELNKLADLKKSLEILQDTTDKLIEESRRKIK